MTDITLVTGGTRGLGAAIVRSLKAGGHEVAAVYHGNDAAAARFEQDTGVTVFKWDVADEAACRDGVAQVEERPAPVSILVDNAGITRDGVFPKGSWDNWRSVLATNLDSMFTTTRAIIEGMRERRFGQIINISSINGQKGQAGQVNYSAAKAGAMGFTKALAQESALRGIPVGCLVIPTRSRWPVPVSPSRRQLSARARCSPSTAAIILPMAEPPCLWRHV